MGTNDLNPFDAPACEQAMQNQIRLLEGILDDAGKAQLEQHVAECPSCRKLQQELTEAQRALQGAFAAAQPSAEFVAKTLARLPQLPDASSTMISGADPRVFSAPRRTRWFVAHARLAAAFIFGLVGVALALLLVGHERALTAFLEKGILTGPSGEAVKELRLGEEYRVHDVTVLTLGRDARLKAQPGTTFQLRAAQGPQPDVKLTVGDVYASTGAASSALRVACASFDAELQAGDYYVAQGAAEAPYGIVIAFTGPALVSPQQSQPVAVGAGQVFVSVVTEDMSFCQTFELRRLAAVEADVTPEASLRADYRTRVASYREQVATLQKQLTETPAGTPQHAELSDRYERVTRYLEAHQRRLETMTPAKPIDQIPFQKIKDGADGYTDPALWLRS